MNYDHALDLANDLLRILSPYCERIEIAGGVRRHKEQPHDIELVAKPKMVNHTGELLLETLDGTVPLPLEDTNALDSGMHLLMRERAIQPGDMRTNHRNGKEIPMKAPFSEKYYNFKYMGEKVDLFVVTKPAQWGPVFTIRTGDANFTHWLVSTGWPKGLYFIGGAIHRITRKKDGSLLQSRYRREGEEKLFADDLNFEVIQTPEEVDVFKALDITWAEPERRSWVSMENKA